MNEKDLNKTLEKLSKKLTKVKGDSPEWADLVIEASATMAQMTPAEMTSKLMAAFDKDHRDNNSVEFSKDSMYLKGWIDGTNFIYNMASHSYPLNLEFLNNFTLAKAIVIKKLQSVRN